jgi:hypothetical protein
LFCFIIYQKRRRAKLPVLGWIFSLVIRSNRYQSMYVSLRNERIFLSLFFSHYFIVSRWFMIHFQVTDKIIFFLNLSLYEERLFDWWQIMQLEKRNNNYICLFDWARHSKRKHFKWLILSREKIKSIYRLNINRCFIRYMWLFNKWYSAGKLRLSVHWKFNKKNEFSCLDLEKFSLSDFKKTRS